MSKTQFLQQSDKLVLRELAQLWGSEINLPPGVIENLVGRFVFARRTGQENSELIPGSLSNFCLGPDAIINREDVEAFCRTYDHSMPSFWRSDPAIGSAAMAHAEFEASKWLDSMASGQKKKRKAAYREEAVKLFPGLSQKGFDRIWRDVTPAGWRKAGRPRKNQD